MASSSGTFVLTPFESRLVQATLVLAMVAAAPASARTYKWVDAQGVTHYSQSMPADASVQVMTLETATATRSDEDACRDLTCRLARLQSQRGPEAR